jgi:hypothetical protein
MRVLSLCLAAVILCCFRAPGQQQGTQDRIPVGWQKARMARTLPSVPPQLKPSARRGADPEQLRREAGELASLAQTVPAQVEQVNTGRLPKDLNERLKRIERLSRQLRRELSP